MILLNDSFVSIHIFGYGSANHAKSGVPKTVVS
jgi:hypothetical protein